MFLAEVDQNLELRLSRRIFYNLYGCVSRSVSLASPYYDVRFCPLRPTSWQEEDCSELRCDETVSSTLRSLIYKQVCKGIKRLQFVFMAVSYGS